MERKKHMVRQLVADWLSALLAWSAFFAYRKLYIETEKFGIPVGIDINNEFFLGLAFLPLCWLGLYFLSGAYRDVLRKSRLRELFQTFITSLLGVTVIFFALILDDEVLDHTTYYQSYTVLFSLHFGLTFLFRFALSSMVASRIQSGALSFPTVMVGSDALALELFNELTSEQRRSGNRFEGYFHVNGGQGHLLRPHLPSLGRVEGLADHVRQQGIEEVIIALESSEHSELEKILNSLDDVDVIVKVSPDMYDIISGSVRMDAIYGTPLIQITRKLMPAWQVVVKRGVDIVMSLVAMLILCPAYLLCMALVRMGSPGPAFYRQERVGKGGKPFLMYKFRSMFIDAEHAGPQLSSDNDPRITPFGRFMRKVRLDEIPQFYNVLKGDMSLVGPRPERQFFIDQIVLEAPHYRHLLKVKPGITSWGMVKYGYAENVPQMIRRMRYDLLYIENMSLLVDLKILIYTVLTVIQGRGK